MQSDRVAGGFASAVVAEQWRAADTSAPWPFRLVPQPFGAGRRRA